MQVLQRSVDKNLNLFSDLKEHTNVVAHVTVLGLSSQPVDHEDNGNRKPGSSDIGEYTLVKSVRCNVHIQSKLV